MSGMGMGQMGLGGMGMGGMGMGGMNPMMGGMGGRGGMLGQKLTSMKFNLYWYLFLTDLYFTKME